MAKTYTKAILWIAAAVVCIGLLSFSSQAADFRMGPGDHYDEKGNIVAYDGTILVTADGTVVQNPFGERAAGTYIVSAKNESGSASSGQAASSSSSSSSSASSASSSKTSAAAASAGVKNYSVSDGVYTFEGKQYRKASSYGVHKLTGYSEDECGTAKTYSGKTARVNHTVSAPSDLPIGTVIILEGESGPYPSLYNGMYVVEDRGGERLESQGIIDIFCASTPDAYYVTDAGWNYAEVWIAEAVN